jgi:hypothetical protein
MDHVWLLTEQGKHLGHLLRSGLVLAFAVLLLAVAQPAQNPVSAQTKQKPGPAAKTRIPGNDFIFGINLPWFDGEFGHDLGPEPQHPEWNVWYNGSKVSGYFADINKIGFRVVRIWLMERAEGLKVDDNGIITDLDDTFLQNLDDLVRRAKDEKLRLYLCLTSGWGEVKYPSPIRDERQQKAYLEKAVRPIAKRLKGNSTVFAFDIINEIESELRDDARHKVTTVQAQAFIRQNVQAIKAEDPKRLVSAGSGYHGWKMVQDGYYKNLGLDFYDIHVYSDDGYLPDVRELNSDKPVIVGECGQATKKDDDELQQKVVPAFMQNAINKGYAGCFVWEYGPKGRFFKIVRDNGDYKPVVADIQKIIKGYKK